MRLHAADNRNSCPSGLFLELLYIADLSNSNISPDNFVFIYFLVTYCRSNWLPLGDDGIAECSSRGIEEIGSVQQIKKEAGKSQPPSQQNRLWLCRDHILPTAALARVLTNSVTLAIGTARACILSRLLVCFFPTINIDHAIFDFRDGSFYHILPTAAFTGIPRHSIAWTGLTACTNINLISWLDVHYAIGRRERNHCDSNSNKNC
jgi:hypothetical protein